MAKHRDFSPSNPVPAGFMDALNEFLGAQTASLVLTKASGTTISVPAGATNSLVALAIEGKWRYVTSTIGPVSAPANSAGTYPIYAISRVNDNSAEDAGTFDYSFSIKLSTAPTGSGSEAISRQIGTYTWDGAAITAVTQTVGGPVTVTDVARTVLDDVSTAAMRATLGLVIGTNVQAWDADLDTYATKTPPSGTVVGTSDTQTLTNKTLTSPTINGGSFTGGTDIAVADGGTGASTASSARTNLGAPSAADPVLTGTTTLTSAVVTTPAASQNASFTLTTTDLAVNPINTATNNVTVTLPASPLDGQHFHIFDATGNALTHNITIARNGKTINGVAANLVIADEYRGYSLVYSSTMGGWVATSTGARGTWHILAGDAGSTNPSNNAQYMKDTAGIVHLRGYMVGGGSENLFAYLPGSYAPPVNELRAYTYMDSGGTPTQFGSFMADSAGGIYVYTSTGLIPAAGTLFYLNGISWAAF